MRLNKSRAEQYCNALRFSTHIYNNEAQVDRLAEALEKILA
jgi:selenocysteine lyase/cysteine desulfurase